MNKYLQAAYSDDKEAVKRLLEEESKKDSERRPKPMSVAAMLRQAYAEPQDDDK